jgi:hypothetical protein
MGPKIFEEEKIARKESTIQAINILIEIKLPILIASTNDCKKLLSVIVKKRVLKATYKMRLYLFTS